MMKCVNLPVSKLGDAKKGKLRFENLGDKATKNCQAFSWLSGWIVQLTPSRDFWRAHWNSTSLRRLKAT